MSRFVAKREDDELGTIYFVRSMRAKRMNIKIHADRLEVSLPVGFNVDSGLEFVDSVRAKIKKKKTIAEEKSILITADKPLQTLTFRTEVIPESRENIFSSMKSGVLTILYPDNLVENDPQTQQYFWNSIDYFLRNDAKRILPRRTVELAKKHGFQISNVKIQSSRTRWGSCSSKKVINLSFYLLLLPEHLIDYVILHELCHTVEMNHSARFWTLLDKVSGGKNEKYRAELNSYSIPK